MDNFEESLARLGDHESNKTRMVLIELDDKLYSMNDDINDGTRIEEDPVIDYYRGYDAMSENVDDKEIKAWRQTFTYLQIFGQGLKFENIAHLESERISDEGKEDMTTHQRISEPQHFNLMENEQLSLVVSGTKILISVASNPCEEEEEIFFSHGNLEETLEIDNSPLPEASSDNIFLSIDPQHSHKAEVVNNLFDALIPDLAEIISPLVQRMVHLCREHGITYTETEERSLCSSEGNECFYSSDDDGEYFPQQEEGVEVEGVTVSEW
jgi:hypothetical protein